MLVLLSFYMHAFVLNAYGYILLQSLQLLMY